MSNFKIKEETMNSTLKQTIKVFSLAIMILFIASTALSSQDKKEDTLTLIAGDYEFDTEGGIFTVKFTLKDGSLYMSQEGSPREPGKLQPVEGKEFEFSLDHPERGPYKIEFFKDEKGKINKCTILIEDYGMDFTGSRLKETPGKKYSDIIGEWEFDIEGYGLLVFKFYIEKEELWVVPVRDREDEPTKIEPVKGKELVFSAFSPSGNSYEFTFTKDDQGKITKCTMFIEQAGIDVDGKKK